MALINLHWLSFKRRKKNTQHCAGCEAVKRLSINTNSCVCKVVCCQLSPQPHRFMLSISICWLMHWLPFVAPLLDEKLILTCGISQVDCSVNQWLYKWSNECQCRAEERLKWSLCSSGTGSLRGEPAESHYFSAALSLKDSNINRVVFCQVTCKGSAGVSQAKGNSYTYPGWHIPAL